MPTNTAHHSGYTYFLPTQPYFTNTQVCLFCGVGVERILSQQIYMFPSMPFSVIIILHNLIKSTVFIIFCPARQLFRHQYYTLNMARLFNKKPIQPLLYKGMVERTFPLENRGVESIKTLSCLIARIGKLAKCINSSLEV